MSGKNDNFQQQILFDELAVTSADKQLPAQNQVIFDNDDWQAIDESLLSESPVTEEKPRRRWLWRIFGVLVVAALGVELGEFFIHGFTTSPMLTGVYAGIVACVIMIAGSTLFRELRGLRQLKKQQYRQQQVNALAEGELVIDGKLFCQQINEQLSCDIDADALEQWQSILAQQHNDQEFVELYSRTVLAKVDEKAVTEIAKFSTESMALVALSPNAILDMALILWRNLRMIDKISGLYGLKLGYWSRIQLIKQVFVNMAYAGASELLTDVGTELMGADLLGKLSGRLAQGAGAGLLTARLGLKAMRMCRPIPANNQQLNIKQIRREMVTQIRALIKARH